MRKPRHGVDQPSPSALQLTIALTTRSILDQRHRAVVVALLSNLLLQATNAQRRDEVDDDHS